MTEGACIFLDSEGQYTSGFVILTLACYVQSREALNLQSVRISFLTEGFHSHTQLWGLAELDGLLPGALVQFKPFYDPLSGLPGVTQHPQHLLWRTFRSPLP
jgi:hypothetical protein